ncbi:all trans-polyprenyl-diphosphate synthase PDSS1-like [Symsagittifera roscoffensis]|uniref:all trans-polyprenyl-diphosphate synthase PDSS1-like n=1 Tax=Symsagittifera roscoffensis TaxID=84072 RepID=UPI00307B6B48
MIILRRFKCHQWSKNLKLYRHCASLASRSSLDPKSVTSYLQGKVDGFQSYLSSLTHLDKFHLNEVSSHAFEGKGKFFRPRLVSLVSMCCNCATINSKFSLQPNQLKLAYISEMIHVASLIHDDVVDNSSVRRSCPSLSAQYGESTAVFAGNFVMAQASVEVASLKNTVVTKLLSQVTEDLVSGELMQLGVKKNSEERLTHYLEKSYRKTASLMAHSCKASSILNAPDFFERHEACFQIGKNIGLAFQLADDLLDFVSAASQSDKPTNADLASGLATAPVLFAAFEHNDLNTLIMRQFSAKGDVKLARDLTLDSSGVRDTEVMIHNHIESAQKLTHKYFVDHPVRTELLNLQDTILNRISKEKIETMK